MADSQLNQWETDLDTTISKHEWMQGGKKRMILKHLLSQALQQERQKIEKDMLEITATGFDCICQPKVLEYFNSLDQPKGNFNARDTDVPTIEDWELDHYKSILSTWMYRLRDLGELKDFVDKKAGFYAFECQELEDFINSLLLSHEQKIRSEMQEEHDMEILEIKELQE